MKKVVSRPDLYYKFYFPFLALSCFSLFLYPLSGQYLLTTVAIMAMLAIPFGLKSATPVKSKNRSPLFLVCLMLGYALLAELLFPNTPLNLLPTNMQASHVATAFNGLLCWSPFFLMLLYQLTHQHNCPMPLLGHALQEDLPKKHQAELSYVINLYTRQALVLHWILTIIILIAKPTFIIAETFSLNIPTGFAPYWLIAISFVPMLLKQSWLQSKLRAAINQFVYFSLVLLYLAIVFTIVLWASIAVETHLAPPALTEKTLTDYASLFSPLGSASLLKGIWWLSGQVLLGAVVGRLYQQSHAGKLIAKGVSFGLLLSFGLPGLVQLIHNMVSAIEYLNLFYLAIYPLIFMAILVGIQHSFARHMYFDLRYLATPNRDKEKISAPRLKGTLVSISVCFVLYIQFNSQAISLLYYMLNFTFFLFVLYSTIRMIQNGLKANKLSVES